MRCRSMRISRYFLFLIPEQYNKKNFGFYRDDELGVVKNKSESETEKIKENMRKI